MIQMKRILCPIDFSDYSAHALKYAIKLAVWLDASVHVLHVMPPMPPSTVSPLSEAARAMTLKSLSHAVDHAWRPDVIIEQELIESAEPAERILERAETLDVDLIITGSHGRTGLERMLLGSVVEALLHRARVPVLIIPRDIPEARLEQAASFRRIVCGIDFSPASITGLAYALAIAEETDAKLTMLNVIEPLADEDYDVAVVRTEAEAAQLTKLHALIPEHARDYCTVETAVMEGSASRQLLRTAAAADADLIVLGVHGRTRLGLAVFGSNSKDVVTRAQCPVLVVAAGPRRSRLRVAS